MDRSRMTRRPTTPGEILQQEYLAPLEMSQKDLADHIGQDVKVINLGPQPAANARLRITRPCVVWPAPTCATRTWLADCSWRLAPSSRTALIEDAYSCRRQPQACSSIG